MRNQENRVLICQVGDIPFGIDLQRVRSIQSTRGLRRNTDSDSPHYFLVTTQGDVPVISLAMTVDEPSREALVNQRIVLIEDGEELWGILIEQMLGAVTASAEMRYPLPINAINEDFPLYAGVINYHGEKIALEIDIDQFHPQQAETRAVIAAFMTGGDQPIIQPKKKKIRDENSAEPDWILPSGTQSTDKRRRQLIVFNVNGLEDYSIGLSTVQVSEIIIPPEMLQIPHAPTGVSGLIFWRNQLIPIVDLAAQLGYLPEKSEDRLQGKRILITRTMGDQLSSGYIIHSVSRLVRLPVPYRVPPKEDWPESPYVKALFELTDHTVIIPHNTLPQSAAV